MFNVFRAVQPRMLAETTAFGYIKHDHRQKDAIQTRQDRDKGSMAAALEPPRAPAAAPESSDRIFGLVFAVVFALIGGWPIVRGGTPRWWAIAIAVVLTLIALAQPQILRPLNRAWQVLGLLLHRVMSPLVMLAIFFLCVTPIAAILRWRGKDVLSLERRPDLSSYWFACEPPQPPAETMRRQF
jgi:Saxitoxin biosynthesis operon protein SxtJ